MSVMLVEDDFPFGLSAKPTFTTSTSVVGGQTLVTATASSGQEATFTVGARKVDIVGLQTRTLQENKKVGTALAGFSYKDDFVRTRATGWGLSPFYGSWSRTSGGVIGDYAVDGNVGTAHPTATASSWYVTIRDDMVQPDVAVKVATSTVPTVASNSASVLTCYSTTNEHYRWRYTFQTTGSSIASITTVVGGVETILATVTGTITGLTAGAYVWVRSQHVGNTLNMYVWKDGSAVPSTPTLTYTEGTPTHTVGRVGLRFFNSAGATNDPTYRIDEFQINAGNWQTPLATTHNTWVRLLPSNFTTFDASTETWLAAALKDTSPDILTRALNYIAGAPVVLNSAVVDNRWISGEAQYGTILTDGAKEEGADWNDYLRRSGVYPNLSAGSATDINELGQQYKLDCSGFLRMVFGFWGGIPMSLDDAADANGTNLPRRSVLIGPSGPGVLIAVGSGAAPSLANIRIGDVVAFNADSADDNAGEDNGDVEETDDHVGIFIGLDGSGNYLFISSRKSANGPTFGFCGGTSYLNGSGFWAVALRHIRRF